MKPIRCRGFYRFMFSAGVLTAGAALVAQEETPAVKAPAKPPPAAVRRSEAPGPRLPGVAAEPSQAQPGAAALMNRKGVSEMSQAERTNLLQALRREYHVARRQIMLKEQKLRNRNEEVQKQIEDINNKIRDLHKQIQTLQKSTRGVYAEADPTLAQEYEKMVKIEETMEELRAAARAKMPVRPRPATRDGEPQAPVQRRPRGAQTPKPMHAE